MFHRPVLRASVAALFSATTLQSAAQAQTRMESVIVTGQRTEASQPSKVESTTAELAAEQVNAVNTEDMLKYLPSLVVRKRHYGDTQDPLATRTSGVGASARNLIYADGILISSPIGNNNSGASPHFGVAAPRDVTRIDVLYGPFAAEYAGNSIGAVVSITTRMPEKFELYGDATGAVQGFDQVGTHQTGGTWQLAGGIGDRSGAFAWRLSANHLDSVGQPLAYATLTRPATASAAGTPVTGAFNDVNRTAAPILVIGAGGIEHQVQDTGTLKLAYELPNGWAAEYTASLFHQDNDATAQSYLRDAGGATVYSGSVNSGGYNYAIPASSFSNNVYNVQQTHLAQGLSLKSAAGGDFAWEIVASNFTYLNDKQRVPVAALPGATTGGAGTFTRLNGTGWTTLDAKGLWRGWRDHDVSFGLHRDQESFAQTKFNTSDWIAGTPGTVASIAKGRTATNALWVQDIWSLASDLKATLGARLEDWRAYDGVNFSAAPALNVTQPQLSGQYVSPKMALAWQAADAWTLTASYGSAWRMPTVTELYQAITTGVVLTVPNPNLKPEHANSFELAAEYNADESRVRLSLFQEDIGNALLSQSAPLVTGSATLYSYVQNVDRVRTRGAELVASQSNVLIPGLDVSGSVTYADGRILRDSAFAAAVGKVLPQLPKWRGTLVATWRADDKLSFTLGARYSDRAFGTIDNSDPVSHTYQGFEGYLVADARVRYQWDANWGLSAGIDNLGDRQYFLFHPFPQRTFVMGIHYAQ